METQPRLPAGRLLLIAPESDFRRSLVFALETEGFSIVLCDTSPSCSWLVSNRFDCTIVDQKALVGRPDENIALCAAAQPVVLLAARPHPWLAGCVAEIVDLPLTGNEVGAAVRRSMHLDA